VVKVWGFLARRIIKLGLVLTGLVVLQSGEALQAQAWWDSAPNGIPSPSIATSLPHRGDPAGIRKRLADFGVIYGFEYTNDVLSNLRGGNRTGTIDQGKLHGIVTVDLEKLAGWQGLTLFSNFFHIHNTGRIRRDYVGGINTIGAIEAVPTTRLSELWLEQKFADGRASIRVGQLAADTEFYFSGLSGMYLQSDWPINAGLNLPSGGPSYPLSTPGVRLKVEPSRDVAVLLAVFNGDPAGPGDGDDQERNKHGLNFRMRDPAFVIGEAQFRRNHGEKATGLAATLKLGGWYHFGRFDDQLVATGGTLLADPAGSGVPITHRGNHGLYAVVDQQIYRPKLGDDQTGIFIFGRASISPSAQNVASLFVDGGVLFSGMIPDRPDDKFGASVMYTRFADSIREFDRQAIFFTGVPGPIRDYEANLEFTYQAQVVPGWTVQPVLTRVWHPNGDKSRNAVVAGVRSLWRF